MIEPKSINEFVSVDIWSGDGYGIWSIWFFWKFIKFLDFNQSNLIDQFIWLLNSCFSSHWIENRWFLIFIYHWSRNHYFIYRRASNIIDLCLFLYGFWLILVIWLWEVLVLRMLWKMSRNLSKRNLPQVQRKFIFLFFFTRIVI